MINAYYAGSLGIQFVPFVHGDGCLLRTLKCAFIMFRCDRAYPYCAICQQLSNWNAKSAEHCGFKSTATQYSSQVQHNKYNEQHHNVATRRRDHSPSRYSHFKLYAIHSLHPEETILSYYHTSTSTQLFFVVLFSASLVLVLEHL